MNLGRIVNRSTTNLESTKRTQSDLIRRNARFKILRKVQKSLRRDNWLAYKRLTGIHLSGTDKHVAVDNFPLIIFTGLAASLGRLQVWPRYLTVQPSPMIVPCLLTTETPMKLILVPGN